MAEHLASVPHIGRMGPHTTALIDRLKDGRSGDVLTDEELEVVAGRACGVGEPSYPNLLKAIKHVTKEHRVVWDRTPGAGAIKCLTAEETVSSGKSDLRTLGRRAKRATHKLDAVEVSDLPEDKRQPFVAMRVQTKVLMAFSHGSMTKKLAVRELAAEPDPKRLLAAMLRDGG